MLGALSAAPALAANGKVAVTISAPQGVPANVLLRGGAGPVAAKPAKGKLVKITLSLAARRYTVVARPLSFGSRSYIGKADKRHVRVRTGRTARVRVRYRSIPSSRSLRATTIAASSLSLAWQAPTGATFALRRAAGRHAPVTRTTGTAVRTHRRSAVDLKLESGKQYSYALFTKVGKRWAGPITLSAGTAPRPGSTAAAFITAPGTLLAEPGEIAAAATTGTGVALRLKDGPPLIGSVVVLPRSAVLAGGFLGRVITVAADGTAVLTAAGLGDAFDFYSLDIPEFKASPITLKPSQTGRSLRGRASRSASGTLENCLGGSVGGDITLKPSVGLGGHFNAHIKKHTINFGFGKWRIPTGASLDMEFTVTATAAVDAKVSESLACGIPFDRVMTILTEVPVPISFVFEPVAEATVSGSTEVTDIGVTATAGFHFAGSFGIRGVGFDGGPIFTAGPTQSQGSIEGSIGVVLGGEVIIGPGAGTTGAGVIAGVGGKLNPVDASIGSVFPVVDKRHNACLKSDAAFTRELNLTAKAWLGDWDISRSVTLEFLKGHTAYPGVPWYWPTDCENAPGGEMGGAGSPTTPPPGPPPPAPPPSLPTLAIVAAGFDSCALLASGHLKCWGDNASGQLGNGTSGTGAQSRTPVDVSEITNATAIAIGWSYACALLEGGQVKCWGSNASGQLGNATTIDSSTPVDVSTITNATAIAAGGDHTCALLSSGQIKCWGNNNSGQLGNATTTDSSTPVDVSEITNATAITTGGGHSCARLPSGQVKCWGSNVYGQLGNGTTTSSSTPVDVSEITNATAITGGMEDSCALLASGQVRCWGHNTNGQLGNATTTDSSTPVDVSEITNASAIAAGDWHTCALLTGGQIQCWGLNGFGELGDGTSTSSWHGPDSSTPVDVSAISDATAIATGSLHSCALLTSGQIKCWGAQARGELGNDSEFGSSTPVAVVGIP